MNKDLTELVFVIDKSGSMGGLESDTIGGFNAMLEEQRKAPGKCMLTTLLFDTGCTLLHERIDILGISPMSASDYRAGGGTALLDAIGTAISRIDNVQAHTAEPFRAGKVMFVIITDGYENASREYSLQQIKALIEERQAEHGWEFIYLGANIDAVQAAGSIGIRAGNAAEYLSDPEGTRLNYSAMSEAVTNYRAGAAMPSQSLDRIREDQKKRGGHKGWFKN